MHGVRDATGIQWVKVMDPAKHPTVHRKAPSRGIICPQMPRVPRLRKPGLDIARTGSILRAPKAPVRTAQRGFPTDIAADRGPLEEWDYAKSSGRKHRNTGKRVSTLGMESQT